MDESTALKTKLKYNENNWDIAQFLTILVLITIICHWNENYIFNYIEHFIFTVNRDNIQNFIKYLARK